ncbi:DUF943 family protein [Erwinia sp. CGal63]|uniref:DUF943 family protein n=1 Tax=Erwinia sp. CGal63 TaxID=2919889 RepID=UPI003009626E
MAVKNKTFIQALTLVAAVALGYLLWLSWRPVEIVAVHQRDHFSDVLVKSFPVTDRGKITWWLENKERLKASYHIPKPASYGGYTITFWLFGEGYKERGKYDRLCFDDMQREKNCIEKEAVFAVRHYNSKKTYFIVFDGRYLLKDNGEIVEVPRD